MAYRFHKPVYFSIWTEKLIKCLKERHHVLRNRPNVRSTMESRTSDEDDCGYSTESDNTFDKTETLV